MSRDGRTLATGTPTTSVRLWDVEGPSAGTVRRARPQGRRDRARVHPGRPRTGHRGSADFTVRLWDVTDPRHVRTTVVLTGHTDVVNAVGLGPDAAVTCSPPAASMPPYAAGR
ncbi:hypothetical protein ACRAWF_16385 [Streptomyces sp. L7]